MSSQVRETRGGFPDGRRDRPTQHRDPAHLQHARVRSGARPSLLVRCGLSGINVIISLYI